MKTTFTIVSALSIALVLPAVQADDECTMVEIKGEINNNIVKTQDPNPLGEYTMGVADLKLKGDRKTVKLTCALLGEPTGNSVYPGSQNYDHMVVCDDGDQSELAFRTGFVNLNFRYPDSPLDYDTGLFGDSPVLSDDEIDDFCGSGATVWFVERADVNGDRRSKGLFGGASGDMGVVGCVNIVGVDQNGAIQEVNMGVSGDLCLPNW